MPGKLTGDVTTWACPPTRRLYDDRSKVKMRKARKRRFSKRDTPRTLFGVRFSSEIFCPEYAQNAYPGQISKHASGVTARRAEGKQAPGGAFCATPGVSVFAGTTHPERGAWNVLDSSAQKTIFRNLVTKRLPRFFAKFPQPVPSHLQSWQCRQGKSLRQASF